MATLEELNTELDRQTLLAERQESNREPQLSPKRPSELYSYQIIFERISDLLACDRLDEAEILLNSTGL